MREPQIRRAVARRPHRAVRRLANQRRLEARVVDAHARDERGVVLDECDVAVRVGEGAADELRGDVDDARGGCAALGVVAGEEGVGCGPGKGGVVQHEVQAPD